jgi:hypothetical protein
MLFEVLVLTELLLCLLLLTAALQTLSAVPSAPELDFGQRAWVAAHFSMAEANALGPLFKHLVRASRRGLRLAHSMQERIRDERERKASGALGRVLSLWQRRRLQRSPELAELAHLVEQLEQMGCAIARYRAGLGMLMDLKVPLHCVQAAETHLDRG